MLRSTAHGGLVWRRSTTCIGGNCVEVAQVDDGSAVAVRDSKGPDVVLMFPADAWNEFLDGVVRGDFDFASP